MDLTISLIIIDNEKFLSVNDGQRPLLPLRLSTSTTTETSRNRHGEGKSKREGSKGKGLTLGPKVQVHPSPSSSFCTLYRPFFLFGLRIHEDPYEHEDKIKKYGTLNHLNLEVLQTT